MTRLMDPVRHESLQGGTPDLITIRDKRPRSVTALCNLRDGFPDGRGSRSRTH